MADALLKLHADVLRHELRIELRLADFGDVHLDHRRRVGLADHSVQSVRKLVDALSASSDNRPGPGREDRDLDAVRGSLDLYAGHVAEPNATLDELAYVVVLL